MELGFRIPFPLLGKKKDKQATKTMMEGGDEESWIEVHDQVEKVVEDEVDEQRKEEQRKLCVIKQLTSVLLWVGLVLALLNYFAAIDVRLLERRAAQVMAIFNLFGGMVITAITLLLRDFYTKISKGKSIQTPTSLPC